MKQTTRHEGCPAHEPAPMRTFGLVGHPLGHSFSRAFFTAKFEREGENARYVNYDMERVEGLRGLIAGERTLSGLNVTIPYKRDVMALLDAVDAEAQAIGAVNVIAIDRSGRRESRFGDGLYLTGYNTDVAGFRESLGPLVEGRRGQRALVLGTGGASAAVAAGLRQLGLEPQFVSRTRRGTAIDYAGITDGVLADTAAVVNATPLGTWPRTDECPDIPYALLRPGIVAFDLVYNPAVTEFMSRCAGQGCTVKNGLEMLHGQAIAAWRIWNGGETP